ncbi:MAG: energy-coupling factor ABC transporter ATP-binding protein [Coriobacteriales bacterium]
MIEFDNVYASYNAYEPVLKGVSFTIEDGAFVAFVGTNGAGKSTTMRLMDGLIKPDEGQVLVDGVPTTKLKTSELASKVGFLFQNPDSQICNNTVRDELAFGFKALHREGPEADERVQEIVDLFGFNPDADPFLLNRGTRQLLALASIVVMEPEVVILDEPTTGLDFRECEKVMDIVRTLHEHGTTVVMVCHDMEVVGDFAEQVIVMNDGQVVDSGPTFEVLRRRETLERASLVPPQIVDLSLALAAADPALADTPVGRANTLGQMEEAVRALSSRGTSYATPADAAVGVAVEHVDEEARR